jgi:hypothetical protein
VSAALPNCQVCLHSSLNEINSLIRQGTSFPAIKRRMNGRRAITARQRPQEALAMPSLGTDQIKDHSYTCLVEGKKDAPSTRQRYIPGLDFESPGGLSIPKLVSAEEFADPVQRLGVLREALAAKLGDLSAKELYAMYMAELKLQNPDPASRRGGDDDDGDVDDAMAAAIGHHPKVVGMRKGRTG